MIAITGLGTISACGVGRGPLLAALAAGRPRLTEVPPARGQRTGRARSAALVDPAVLETALRGRDTRRMSPPSRLALVAAAGALEEAGLAPTREPDPGLAVVASTAFGPSSFTTRLFDQILDEGPAAASPALFTECVANAAVAQVDAVLRAGGPSYALAQGEAGPLRAVARAASEIALGRARRALAGAVEEMPPLVHALLDRVGALAAPGGELGEQGRPFDRDRRGFHAGEGATFLVLEEEGEARNRGASVAARLRAAGSAFDASAPTAGFGTGGARLARALRAGLDRAGLGPDGIDLVVSGASGSRAGDRLEAEMLRAVWGNRPLPPVLTPKAITGEYGGAFLAAALLAARGEAGGAQPWFGVADEACRIVPHRGPIPPGAKTVLVTSVAAGGCASWIVLERP
ncbi:MAG TPA: beta-ketoacyl synthase N-terminal-like domain-containing protein [Candidatus Polarisedimenticolia bacterium]|nr:beta-ketoacyl synthase N-terminal-like domain-containing protein [Candidatus Polarisedimenticolia bacterium]